MPIASNQIRVAEIHMQGIITAGGSSTRVADAVFHYRRTSVTNPPNKTNLESAFQTNVALPILAALNNRYTQTSNTVRWIDDALDAPMPVSRAIAGSVAGDSMTTINAVYILMRTGLRGRSYRGSKHFFPLSESDTTAPSSDILNAGSQALWATAVAGIGTPFTDINGNTWNLTILSRKQSQLTKNPTTVVVNDVSLLLLNKRIGRMRHREVRSLY